MYLRLTNVCFENTFTSMFLVYVEILLLITLSVFVFTKINSTNSVSLFSPITKNMENKVNELDEDVESQSIVLNLNTY